ncbi:MAG: histone deacetylase [Myxococcota bacterium]
MKVAIPVMVLAAGAAWALRLPPSPPPRDGAVIDGHVVIAYSPGYRVSFFGIERLHPFDIAKYDKIAQHLRDEGLAREADFFVPDAPTVAQLGAVHDPAYLTALRDPAVLSRAIEVDLPGVLPGWVLERRVLRPFRRAVGGTVVAARGAIQHGMGINIGGGYHHARPEMGHGFCVYNDVAYALHVLRSEGFDKNVLIVDTDAHQGDGNHAFFQDDPSVYSMSLHQQDLFPHPKLKGDMDIGLSGGIRDDAFLETLEGNLAHVLDQDSYGLLIHVAGSDILADDPLAGMAVSVEGLVARDRMVARAAAARQIPLLIVLAGGYGPSSALAQGQALAAVLRDAQENR